MGTLDLFKEIAQTNYNKYLEDAKSKGTKIIGYFCNVPEEIIMAAGMIPYRMRAVESTKTTLGDIWYSTINCSFPRNCLDQILEGKFDFLDGLVVMNSCDHVRRLYDNCKYGDLWPGFLYMLAIPHVITPESISQFKREINRFKLALEEHFGIEITQERIKEAISACNHTRRLLTSLYELRKKDPPPIKGAEALAVIMACTALPKEVANASLETLLSEINGRAIVSKGTPRLMIAAGYLEEIDYMELLEKDAVVVADSLCFGSRYLENLVDENKDNPIEALANRYTSIA
ncbi:MAG: 2-hydroxyacyl-CoA dehydratase family protein, partial [Thermodesulfobacteriota bacterium]|nr:2-hydroxyacyl-CoA dehydratase family protein [Thermodesulfobacteriota bacterium]